MDRTRWLALVAAAVVGLGSAGGAAELPRPEIPDPYGLGERLALIDHLRTALHVVVPDDASEEQLVALYWQAQRDRPPTAEEALARDRCDRLRRRLADEFAIVMADDADEAALAARLDDATAARSAARGSTRIAGSEVDALRALVAHLADDARTLRARADDFDERRRALVPTFTAGKQRLDAAAAAQDQAAYETQRGALAELVRQDSTFTAAQKDAVARAAALDVERDKAEAELARLVVDAAGGASTAAPGDAGAPAQGAALEARLKAAVVLVIVAGRGSGTGFFVSGSGLVVTNAHVLGAAREAQAVWDHDAHRPAVRLRAVQVDAEADLALLRADDGAPFVALALGTDYALSAPVLAVGYPLAGAVADTLGTSPSDIVVSRGILSSVRKRAEQVEWLQHDCAIASGSSGGPLIAVDTGAVIGVNSRVLDPKQNGGAGAALALAIPADQVKRLFAAQLAAP